MANEIRSLRVPAPPSTQSSALDQWMRDVSGVINSLPISIFSTTGGPNASGITAPRGFFGIEVGSSATKFWFKEVGSDNTGWSYVSFIRP